jgi:tetrahydromethanopterin S-methyltransferase subunit A
MTDWGAIHVCRFRHSTHLMKSSTVWMPPKTILFVPSRTESIRPSDFVAQDWPAQPGNYRVFNATKSIALALLQDVDLDDPSLSEVFASVAIVGTIATENLGVEHLVKNVIANPYLRHLLLWGENIEGHFPGDALRNLAENGLDSGK